MDPITIITMVSAALSFAKEAIPQIQEWVNNGEISKEDQEKLLAEYKSLKDRANGEFSGPEWESSGR